MSTPSHQTPSGRRPDAHVPPDDAAAGLARRSPFRPLVRSSWLEQAVGIVVAVRRCSPEEACDQLMDVAAAHQLPVRAVSRQLVAQASGSLMPPTSTTIGRRGESVAEVVHRHWGAALDHQRAARRPSSDSLRPERR